MTQSERMLSLDEALGVVDATLADARLPAETVATRAALGRTLAADQVSRLDLPPFDKSAMDGYAIRADDERDSYRLLETVAAGQVGGAALAPGTTVRVMTGAPVPAGAGRVIMQEDTERDGETVRVRVHRPAANICLRGEDVRVGDVVLPAGTTITAVDIANLIACGIVEVEVRRAPRLAVISTGDEIADSLDDLAPGRIMNSNGPLLCGLAEEFRLPVVGEWTLPDQPHATVRGILEALERAEIVVISGGVSVGEFDYVLPALAEAGLTVHFCRVATKPGKPMTYASGGGKVVFGLPGNPVSVHLAFHLFVLRAVAHYTGGPAGLRTFSLPLASDFKRKKTDRTEFVPARLTDEGAVAPVEFHGSAHLAAMTHADGFFIVPAGVAALGRDDRVAFVPLLRRRP